MYILINFIQNIKFFIRFLIRDADLSILSAP